MRDLVEAVAPVVGVSAADRTESISSGMGLWENRTQWAVTPSSGGRAPTPSAGRRAGHRSRAPATRERVRRGQQGLGAVRGVPRLPDARPAQPGGSGHTRSGPLAVRPARAGTPGRRERPRAGAARPAPPGAARPLRTRHAATAVSDGLRHGRRHRPHRKERRRRVRRHRQPGPLVWTGSTSRAKRYAAEHGPGAGRRELVGALAVAQGERGVFLTTSMFSRGARDEAGRVHKRLELFDGERLADMTSVTESASRSNDRHAPPPRRGLLRAAVDPAPT